jgi:predicted MarR family transcription regulator
VAATKAGTDACQRYHEIRERLVVKPVKGTGLPDPTLGS